MKLNHYEPQPEFFDAMYMRAGVGMATTAVELNHLVRGASQGTVEIFRSYTGVAIGYVTYARINRWTLDWVIQSKLPVMHPHEWNEGYISHVMDFVLLPGQRTLAIRRFRNWFKRQRLVSYLTPDGVHLYKRQGTFMRCLIKP